ncbi:hypothetical protein ACFY05_42900 [Microtetraspora fusca]|uniref:Uncharacterized protein n=1 Tax=Microtetraspora fusca TaxID=1997 RepID=A0ABW6VJQ1_MICFU
MGTALSGFESLTGAQWQDLCMRVLHHHHGGGELIEVPDDDGGDNGLEAFSLDGCVYQCYAPDNEPLTTAVRYTKQRDKMTRDIGKFITNEEKLKRILPPDYSARRWILLVPYINTKRLAEHARTQTERLRNEHLPYTSQDIYVVAHTLRSYEAAKAAVIARRLDILRIPTPDNLDFGHIDDPAVDRMKEKLAKTSTFRIADKRDRMVDRYLKNHVAGQANRDWLRDEYAELNDDLEERLADLESRLEMQYPLDHPDPNKLLATVLKDTEMLVSSTLNSGSMQSRVIAEGQVAEWLMRCPLDFP